MSAESIVCYNCDEVGYISRNCSTPAENNTGGYTKQGKKDSKSKVYGSNAGSGGGGGAGENGAPFTCPRLRTTLSATSRERHARVFVFTTADVLDAHKTLAGGDNEKPTFELNDDFNCVFLWMAATKGRASLPN